MVVYKRRGFLYISALLISLGFASGSSPQRPTKAIQLEKELFSVNGNSAFVILPDKVDRKKPFPWVWFAPTIDIVPTENDSWMFEQFLENGIAIAGIDVW